METIMHSVNKTIEDKWAPILKANPKKKSKSNEIQSELNIDNPRASCSFSNSETVNQNLEENSISDNYESEAEDFSSEEEIIKSEQNKSKMKKFHVAPKIIFSPENVPKLIAEHMKISQPITKNSSFSVHISNNTIGLLKGQMENPITINKFDIKTQDSEMSEIFSHINSKFSVYDIPENCFSVSPSNKFTLKNVYKNLGKQQEVLKALLIHAELNISNFNLKVESQAKDLLKTFIHPIDIQISTIHDTIRRIRSIAIPSYLPLTIKKSLKSAPILPGKLWNISSNLISRIQSQKPDTFKTNKVLSSYRPFPIRGRLSDRRGRPQRRGGLFRRRGSERAEIKQEK